jgi:nitrate reductase delta subunit
MSDPTVFDRLSDALSYPTDGYQDTITACVEAVRSTTPKAVDDIECFERAGASMTLAALQELYATTFDFNPQCSLDAGWHIFGETHDRGPFLASLRVAMREAGIAETAELPDHVTHLLRLIGRSTPVRAAEYAALMVLALDRIIKVLESDHNPYASLLRAARATASPDLRVGPAVSRATSTSADAGPAFGSGNED